MDWTVLGKKLREGGLQALGAALGGPAGAAAGAILAERLGAAEADPEVVRQVIETDPEAAQVLADLDIEMEREKRETLKLAIGADEAAMATAEANIREARLQPDLNPTRRLMTYVTLAALLLTLAALVAVEVKWDIPDMVLGLAVATVGMLASQFQQMVGFFFGTSSGSAAKERTAAMERMSTRDAG